jgi:hypothetical protein
MHSHGHQHCTLTLGRTAHLLGTHLPSEATHWAPGAPRTRGIHHAELRYGGPPPAPMPVYQVSAGGQARGSLDSSGTDQ